MRYHLPFHFTQGLLILDKQWLSAHLQVFLRLGLPFIFCTTYSILLHSKYQIHSSGLWHKFILELFLFYFSKQFQGNFHATNDSTVLELTSSTLLSANLAECSCFSRLQHFKRWSLSCIFSSSPFAIKASWLILSVLCFYKTERKNT